MIHRYIHELLTEGVATYQANPELMDDIFDVLYELDEKEAESIKTYFLANGLNVYNGYPRLDSKHPFVAIILASEGEAETFLGDYAGMITEEGEFYGMDVKGSFWNHVFQLPVVSEHPDITTYLYEMVKVIMIAGLPFLTAQECHTFSFSGADLAPDARYIPNHLFVRQLTFSCQRQLALIDRASKLNKAWQVSGLHIDSSGSPRDVGDVETLITPYAVGDSDAEET